MAFMRTSNPTLNDQVFRNERTAFGNTMTVQGAVNKTGILLLCAIATAAWTWNLAMHSESPAAVAPLVVLGSIGGLVVAMVTIFKKQWSAITAPLMRCWKDWLWAQFLPFLRSDFLESPLRPWH